jgi:histidine triad (HIT) family protein
MSEDVTNNCIFCNIVSGKIPSIKIHENDSFIAILDKFPGSLGHTLILPKKHVPISPMLDPKDSAVLGGFIKEVNSKLVKGLQSATTIFIANGQIAGQKSPHLIVHVIPRKKGDDLPLNPKRSEKEGYKEMHKKIVATIGGNEKTDVLMEDDDIIILHPKDNFVLGELKIFVKQKYVTLDQVPSELLGKLMQVTNKLSALLFDKIGCLGTNVLIQNGVEAGQTEDFFSLNILPRFEKDGLNFEWQPKEASESELTQVTTLINSALSKEKEEEYQKLQKQKVETSKQEPEDVKEEDDYLSRSLDRLP